MVLMNAPKTVRCQASLTNLPTCGGTAKKSGLGPRVGWFMTSNPSIRGAPQKLMKMCVPSKTIQTQKYGYSAVHSGKMG
jgi:hypothetical protein